MSTEIPDPKNTMLDRIIVERRSHRQFRQEFLPVDDIRDIIHAGLHAPFAAAAMRNTEDISGNFLF
jgi:nitroreductase